MLDAERIARNINKKLKNIGINPEVNGEPSHTANLVSTICSEIVKAIKRDAEVQTTVITTVNTQGISSSPGTPEVHIGSGSGQGLGKIK